MSDIMAIACNDAGSKVFPKGALCFVIRFTDGPSAYVIGRSRGGRWVVKWEQKARLFNFRYKKLPMEHPMIRAMQQRICVLWVEDQWTPEQMTSFCAGKAWNPSTLTPQA